MTICVKASRLHIARTLQRDNHVADEHMCCMSICVSECERTHAFWTLHGVRRLRNAVNVVKVCADAKQTQLHQDKTSIFSIAKKSISDKNFLFFRIIARSRREFAIFSTRFIANTPLTNHKNLLFYFWKDIYFLRPLLRT